MPARLAESPLTCVATGSGQALEEFEAIKRALEELPGAEALLSAG